MKKLLTIILLLPAICSFAQTDTISLNEGNFHIAYSTGLKYPVKVYWHLTANDLNCSAPLKRSNKFTADPQAPGTNYNSDYSRSGYDKGHNFDAADDACNIELNAHCWYFTNMTPQVPELNRVVWKNLEDQCRKWALAGDNLFIECGSIGNVTVIGQHSIAVPTYCWKVIKHSDGRVECYIMPNIKNVKSLTYDKYPISLEDLQKETGLTL